MFKTCVLLQGFILGLFVCLASICLGEVPLKGQIISGYVRAGHIQYGWISSAHLNKTNDIIYMHAEPDVQGNIVWAHPDIRLRLSKDAILNQEFAGKKKVYTGSKLTNGSELPFLPEALQAWTFEGLYYLSKPGERHFLLNARQGKVRFYWDQSKLCLQDGGTLYSAVVPAEQIKKGWVHLAVVRRADSVQFFYNQVALKTQQEKREVKPHSQEYLGLAQGAREMRIWTEARIPAQIARPRQPRWEDRLLRACWDGQYSKNPGLSSASWYADILWMRSQLKNPAQHMIRVSIAGGPWKDMLRDPKARENFAKNVAQMIKKYKLDGVDLDFEWIEGPHKGDSNEIQWKNYADLAQKIRKQAPKTCFSISLHAVCYRMPAAGIEPVDYFTMQNYGPSFPVYTWENYTNSLANFRKQGFPNEKLMLSVPFQGTMGKGAGSVRLYRDIVAAHPKLAPELDEVQYEGSRMVFNGVNMIRRRAELVKKEKLRGVMYWDMGGDVAKEGKNGPGDYQSKHSLLRVLNEVIHGRP